MWIPDFLKNLSTANYGMWNAPDPAVHPDGSITPGEGGVDVGVPIGTPVLAIGSGTVVGSGYWKDNAHGVVTILTNVPGVGPENLYYQHIQIDPSIKMGQTNQRGQQIGTIGPFNEIEMGFNSKWGQPWGTNPPGPWVSDPRPWLNAILSGNGAAPATTTASGGGFNVLDPTTWLPTLKQWGEYIGIFLLALMLIIIGFFLLAERQAMQAAKAVA